MTDERQHYCSRCLTTFLGNPESCSNLSCGRARPEDGWGAIFNPGDIFDRNYRIHKMLAMGGAGVSYVARETDDDGEDVGPLLALKVLLAARDQGSYVRRLSTEAQIIQELDHPNIVCYLGFVHRTGHSPYLITRFERGGCLLDHMRRVGTLSVRQTAVIGQQICRALIEAHQRDIIHRDLKPENVLLEEEVAVGEDATLRVADFGIAKIQGSLNSNLTRVGAFVGTPHYAAPEQFLGKPVSPASDVYSVGAMLYFCMAAKHVVRLADRMDPYDTHQLLVDSLPVSVPATAGTQVEIQRMDQILTLAMDQDPKRRVTATELNAMLTALLAGRQPGVPARLTTSQGLELPDAQTTASTTFMEDEITISQMGASQALSDSSRTKEQQASTTLSKSADSEEATSEPLSDGSAVSSQKKGKGIWIALLLLCLIGGGAAGGVLLWPQIEDVIGLESKSKKSSEDDDGDEEAASDGGSEEEGSEEDGSGENGSGETGSEDGAGVGEDADDGGAGSDASEGGTVDSEPALLRNKVQIEYDGSKSDWKTESRAEARRKTPTGYQFVKVELHARFRCSKGEKGICKGSVQATYRRSESP
jgi:serine/threonine protein kinase